MFCDKNTKSRQGNLIFKNAQIQKITTACAFSNNNEKTSKTTLATLFDSATWWTDHHVAEFSATSEYSSIAN
jgi:hypothetical protein